MPDSWKNSSFQVQMPMLVKKKKSAENTVKADSAGAVYL